MPRPKKPFPKYCIHRRSGRAYVTINGRQVSLGPANTPESRTAFDRIIAEWLGNGRSLPQPARSPQVGQSEGPTVSVLLDAFWTYAETYYVKPELDDAGNPLLQSDGSPKLVTSEELENYRHAIRPLRRLYGAAKVADFGCAQLEALRSAMITPAPDTATGKPVQGWSRAYCNRQVGRIKRIFGWGVIKKMVPATVYAELLILPGLHKGKSKARETAPVKPVDQAKAMAIVPHVSRQVGAMIRVQLLTGMRSTEICIMRPIDIDRTVFPWVYRPMFHKTEHHDIPREIPFGPQVRDIIEPFIADREPTAYIFSPIEAEAERRKLSRAKRTYVQPSQILRSELAAKRKNKRTIQRRYTKDSYYRAVIYGCQRTFVMPAELKWRKIDTPAERKAKYAQRAAWLKQHGWHPHQARHRAATDMRRDGGLESASLLLGHSNQKTTLIYAEADVARAHALVERTG